MTKETKSELQGVWNVVDGHVKTVRLIYVSVNPKGVEVATA